MSELVKGLFFKPKKEKQPDFVLGGLSAKREELIEFLKEQSDEWVNMQILMSKAGKPYISVDDWKPTPQEDSKEEKEEIGDLPF